MYEVNVTELRNHLPKYLSSVQKGEEILVTSHGQVIARIIPPINTQNTAQEQLKNLRKSCKVMDVITPLDEDWNVDK